MMEIPMRRVIPLGTLLSLVLGPAIACDPYYQIVVTAPLARPLSADCVRSALDTITRSTRTLAEPDSHPPKRAHGTLFRLGGGTPYAAVRQYEYRDSTAALETQVGRFGPFGGRFSKVEAESLGHEMGAILLRVRDTCGGSGLIGSSPYEVKRKPL
jgi:hypothetical protein